MRTAYRYLAYLMAGLVGLQAASHAWSSAGLVHHLGQGGTLDFQSDAPPAVPEFLGVMIHAMTGMYIIPVVALVLLAVGLASKLAGAVQRAALVLVLVVVQVALGVFGHDMTALAFLHGANALVLFAVALWAARAVDEPSFVDARRAHTVGSAL